MNQRIYMLGGVDLFSGEISPLDQLWIDDAGDKPICIVDLTSNDADSRPTCRDIMRAHFSKLTVSELLFVSEQPTHDDILSALEQAGVIYLPGGDTEALLQNISKLNLWDTLLANKLSIAGNSAGALAMCKEVVLTTDEDIKTPQLLDGLGLVPFSIDPHYDSTHDDELIELSAGRVIYGLPEQSGIIVKNSSIEFIGSVWRFADGCKEKVN